MSLHLARPMAEEHSFPPFPCFGSRKDRFDEDDSPFPRDPRVLKDIVIDDWNVKGGEDGDEAGNDGPEQELVAPHVVHPLGEVLVALGLHSKEAAPHVDHLPSEEQGKPGEACKGGSSRPEDRVTFRGVGIVAVSTEVAISECKDDQDERCHAKSRGP
jgi:hypothetical protein